jgi:hypothetical protein
LMFTPRDKGARARRAGGRSTLPLGRPT